MVFYDSFSFRFVNFYTYEINLKMTKCC